jgi:hypothetical protein
MIGGRPAMMLIRACPLFIVAFAAAGETQPDLYRFPPSEYKMPSYCSTTSRVERLGRDVYRVEWQFKPEVAQPGGRLSVRLRFQPDRPDLWVPARREFHWIPNIKQQPDHVASDHVFRSPAAVLTAGGTGIALIPDLDQLARHRPVSQYLDMRFPDGEAPYVEFGYAGTEPDGHTYYKLSGRWSRWEFVEPVILTAFLITGENTTGPEFVARVSSFLWDMYGHGRVQRAEPQTAPFATVANYGYDMALRDLWVKGPEPGTGGITLTTYLDPKTHYRGRDYPRDLWFHSWFNNMRTAYGLYQWGKRLNRRDWTEKAVSVARLLVLSPKESGLFSTIYIPEQRRWQSSGQGGGPTVYHLPDNAWSAIWLLRFQQECEPIPGAGEMLHEFAMRLLSLQHPDGGFPARVETSSLKTDTALDGTAEGAMSLWFLGEMVLRNRLTGAEREEAVAAIQRGLDFLHTNAVGPQRFEDFELTFSCSPKPLGYFDPVTQLFAQGTLALQWSAEAFRVGYLVEHRDQDLKDGLFCLDLLNQYQQVWNPPYLDFDGFGGYGVMNTDGEWNDARQAQFAETNANYFDLTGDRRCLERAVAAARAAFTLVVMDENKPVAPRNYRGTPINYEVHGASAENYGHSGWNARSYQSGFHWGTGSALTTAVILTGRYGDLYVDPVKQLALGIDGVAAAAAHWGPEIDLQVQALPQVERFNVKSASGAELRLRVNGRPVKPKGSGLHEAVLR